MPESVAIVSITESQGADTAELPVAVRTLDELYRACRDAPPSRVVTVAIRGPEGEVRLNFASFIKKS